MVDGLGGTGAMGAAGEFVLEAGFGILGGTGALADIAKVAAVSPGTGGMDMLL
jgi:hypothetical protein